MSLNLILHIMAGLAVVALVLIDARSAERGLALRMNNDGDEHESNHC